MKLWMFVVIFILLVIPASRCAEPNGLKIDVPLDGEIWPEGRVTQQSETAGQMTTVSLSGNHVVIADVKKFYDKAYSEWSSLDGWQRGDDQYGEMTWKAWKREKQYFIFMLRQRGESGPWVMFHTYSSTRSLFQGMLKSQGLHFRDHDECCGNDREFGR